MERTPYEYQVEVNNPGLVTGYKLREKNDNVTVSPTGKVQVRPPATVLTPMQIGVALDITGPNGQSVLHEFSLLVLPRKVPTLPVGARPLGSGSQRPPGIR
jgi:hypothetical protein